MRKFILQNVEILTVIFITITGLTLFFRDFKNIQLEDAQSEQFRAGLNLIIENSAVGANYARQAVLSDILSNSAAHIDCSKVDCSKFVDDINEISDWQKNHILQQQKSVKDITDANEKYFKIRDENKLYTLLLTALFLFFSFLAILINLFVLNFKKGKIE